MNGRPGEASAPHPGALDVFALRDDLVAEYERFSRSFTRIRGGIGAWYLRPVDY